MSFSKSKAGFLLFTFLLVMSLPLAFGQGITTGGLTGTVVDQNQAVISGATITAVQAGTNSEFKGVTNDSGAFTIRGLQVGTYTVTIEAPKFATIKTSNVVVTSAKDTSLGDQVMRVGAAGEVVEVEGTAPMVESTSAQISTSFSSRKVAELPLGGGNGFDVLALLVPGAASTHDAGFSNTNGAGISMNGQRGRSNNFQIDGQSNNDNSVGGPSIFFGNQDGIAEYNVISNNFSAEYGRNLGSVINILTKAGTNAFHGTAFEFHQNSFFSTRTNQDKIAGLKEAPRALDNRFGGSFGGPIVKDKLWFFGTGNFERFNVLGNISTSGTSLTPTPAGLATLKAAFPGNNSVNAISTIGPFAVKLGNPTVVAGTTLLLPVSDGTTRALVEFGKISRAVKQNYRDNEATSRVDWQISNNDRFFGRYDFQQNLSSQATGRFAAGAIVDVPGRSQQVGLDYTHNFGTNILNQARVGYSRANFGFEAGTFPGCTRADINNCPTGISAGGSNLAFGIQSNLPQGRIINNYQFQDNASWVKGHHSFKFGGEYGRQRSPNVFLPNINGTFTFSSSTGTAGGSQPACSLFLPASADRTATTCGFSRFLANRGTLSLTDGPKSFNFRENDLAFYFQDDWKVFDNLTLNMGLRWEYFQQAINLLHDLTVARESNPATAFFSTAVPLANRTIARTPEAYKNFGPNIGFAYTPRVLEGLFGHDKTVIRGGFRIAYDPAFYNIFLNVATSAPVVNAGTITGCVGCLPSSATGTAVRAQNLPLLPRGANPGLRNQTIVSKNFHNPYSEQYSLGVERQITSKIAAEVRYVGNHTVGNFQSIDANPDVTNLERDFPGIVSGIAVCPAGTPSAGLARPDCSRTPVRARTNGAYSLYNSLQTRLDFQNFHGLTAGVAYTYSRTIDNVSEIFGTFGGGNTVAFSSNPLDTKIAERGLSGTSYPNVASLYYIYDLPWFKQQQGFIGHLLGGYQVNGVYRYNSGQPFTPAQFNQNSYCDAREYGAFSSFVDFCRPLVSNPNAPVTAIGQCTSTTLPGCALVNTFTGAPTTPNAVHFIVNDNTASLLFGGPFARAVGRNTLRAQPFNNLDFGVYKNLKITERINTQLQWNVFNLLNHQYRGTGDVFVDDGATTFANGSTAPAFTNNLANSSNQRTMIFGLKIIF